MNVSQIEDKFIEKALTDELFIMSCRYDLGRLNLLREVFKWNNREYQFEIISLWIKFNQNWRKS